MNFEKILFPVFLSVSVISCKVTSTETEIITGRVLWDQNKDGNYSPTDSATVKLKNFSETDSLETLTNAEGTFVFTPSPGHRYTLVSYKLDEFDFYIGFGIYNPEKDKQRLKNIKMHKIRFIH